MDKPDLERARAIFHDRREIMMQPQLRHRIHRFERTLLQQEFDSIRDQALFCPTSTCTPPATPITICRKAIVPSKNL